MVRIPEEAKRKLSEVPEQSSFKMHFGAELRSLEDLYHVFEQISEESFNKHVNEDKNDFSSWIRYTVKDIELADRLDLTTDFEETKAVIKSRIDYLKNKIIEAEENPAYVDSNRSDFISGIRKETVKRDPVVEDKIETKETISKLKPRFPGFNLKKDKAEEKDIKPKEMEKSNIESSINIDDNYDLLNKGENKMNNNQESNQQQSYPFPPPANETGFGGANMNMQSVSEPQKASDEKAHIPIKVIKKYVHEAMRDVLIGMTVGICIGFFIGWSVVGAIGA